MRQALSCLALLACFAGCETTSRNDLGSDFVPATDAGLADADLSENACYVLAERLVSGWLNYQDAGVPARCRLQAFDEGCPLRESYGFVIDCLNDSIGSGSNLSPSDARDR